MILLVGNEPSLMSAIERALDDAKVGHRSSSSAMVESLFMQAFESKATAIVVVEELPRAGEPTPPPRDEFLAQCLSGAHAPGVKKLVLVSARDEGDPMIQRIKKDGVSWVLVRPAPLAALRLAADVPPIAGRSVLVPAGLESPNDMVTTGSVAREVVRVTVDDRVGGEIVEHLRPTEGLFDALIREAGGVPRSAGPLRTKLANLFGELHVEATATGAEIRRSKTKRVARPAPQSIGFETTREVRR